MSDTALVLRESVLEIAGNEHTILEAVQRRHMIVIRPRPYLYPLGATRFGVPGATNIDIADGRLVVWSIPTTEAGVVGPYGIEP